MSIEIGEECLTVYPRFWYECENGTMKKAHQHPGTILTDPGNDKNATLTNSSYWVYTHFGLNIIWIVTMLLLLLNCSSDASSNGNTLAHFIIIILHW